MDIRHSWQFAAVQALLPLLAGTHSVPTAKPDVLEQALNTPEHPLLAQIHAKLLRLPASSQQKWRGSILRYINNHPQYFDEHLPTLASEEDYDSITPYDKLLLLHALAEAVLSEHPPDATVDQLRPFPVGYDALKNQYWYFGDAQRVYREPGEAAREKEERKARAEEQRRRDAEKEERRREREEKRVQTDKKKEERRKKNAKKWAPRVAVGRSTRASRRLQEKADMTRDADGQPAAGDGQEPMNAVEKQRDAEEVSEDANEKSDAVMDDWLLREIGITSDDDDDIGNAQTNQPTPPSEEEHHAPRRSGRRRKPIQQPESPPAKRPRRRDPSSEAIPSESPPPLPPPPKRKEFADPTLRACTEWETLTTDAAELRAFIERFGAREKLAPVERSLLKRLDEVLPEMDEAEARAKREADRKAKAEFLILNQKRSTRVRAIRSRREEEAKLEAEREEKEREEAARLAAHQHAVLEAIAFLVRDQSRDIRGVRREFGMDQEIDRDEGAVRKQEKEKALRMAAAAPVRRSARSHRTRQKLGDEAEQNTGADTSSQTPETTVGATPETTETITGSVNETAPADGLEAKDSETEKIDASQRDAVLNAGEGEMSEEPKNPGGVYPEQNEEQQGDVTMKSESTDGTLDQSHPDQEREDKDLGDRGTMIDSAEGTAKSSPAAEPSTEQHSKRPRFSSAPAEESVSPAFTWSTNDEDKLPMRVLDKFFFASHSNFADAQLEDCEDPKSNMVGFGLLIPPTTSEPFVERVELSGISEWMFEYGGSPKIWIRTRYAWYELREPAAEYEKTFTTARRKFEICARVAIMGETMRGPQLNYGSILDYLSYPYGEMRAYKEEDVLSEKRYIVLQMELLQKRSLLQSGFVRELQKRIRAEDKKAAMARAKAETHKASLLVKQEEELAGVKEEDIVIVPPLSKLNTEKSGNSISQSHDVKRESKPTAKVAAKSEEKKVKEKSKRVSKKRGGKSVPRAVSAIVNGLIRAATKSHKTPRKRKSKGSEAGASPVLKKPVQQETVAVQGTTAEDVTTSPEALGTSVAQVPNGAGIVSGLDSMTTGQAKDGMSSDVRQSAVKPFARRAVRKERVGVAPRLVGHGMSPFVGSPRPVYVGKTGRFGYINGVRREDGEKE